MGCQILLGGVQIGFFLEALHTVDAGHAQIGIPLKLDIAVAGLRIGGGDADGHQILVPLCHSDCLTEHVHVHLLVADEVV